MACLYLSRFFRVCQVANFNQYARSRVPAQDFEASTLLSSDITQSLLQGLIEVMAEQSGLLSFAMEYVYSMDIMVSASVYMN